MKCPSIVDVRVILKSTMETNTGIEVAGQIVWVPARAQWSVDNPITRIRAAWLVFTGRADAVFWPGQ